MSWDKGECFYPCEDIRHVVFSQRIDWAQLEESDGWRNKDRGRLWMAPPPLFADSPSPVAGEHQVPHSESRSTPVITSGVPALSCSKIHWKRSWEVVFAGIVSMCSRLALSRQDPSVGPEPVSGMIVRRAMLRFDYIIVNHFPSD